MDKLRAKSAALAEAGKAQEAAKEAAEDLRAFVEVLTTFCDDPRDLAAVRSSEATLKTQLAQLRLELQGGDPQVG
jgi:E3 ubiquitin-protein ligase BRE1